jgi:hypothetical protein
VKEATKLSRPLSSRPVPNRRFGVSNIARRARQAGNVGSTNGQLRRPLLLGFLLLFPHQIADQHAYALFCRRVILHPSTIAGIALVGIRAVLCGSAGSLGRYTFPKVDGPQAE